jgi:hypothetical protein
MYPRDTSTEAQSVGELQNQLCEVTKHGLTLASRDLLLTQHSLYLTSASRALPISVVLRLTELIKIILSCKRGFFFLLFAFLIISKQQATENSINLIFMKSDI